VLSDLNPLFLAIVIRRAAVRSDCLTDHLLLTVLPIVRSLYSAVFGFRLEETDLKGGTNNKLLTHTRITIMCSVSIIPLYENGRWKWIRIVSSDGL
jgi:hypothetical protein